jgi:hypothetical protein
LHPQPRIFDIGLHDNRTLAIALVVGV